MIRMTLAARLKYYRKAAGLTAAEVGAKIGKSEKTVSAWECGRGQPDADMLLSICKIYGIKSIAELFGEEPPREIAATRHELAVLDAYRAQPDVVRSAVDRMLGVQPETVADPVDLAAELAQNLPKKIPTGK